MHRFGTRLITLAASGIFMPLAVMPATAQESALPRLDPVGTSIVDQENGIALDVRQRVRDEFAPMGVRLGTFQVFPSVALGAGYDSNLFANPTDRKGAPLVQFEPSVSARSDLSNGEMRLEASGRLTRFPGNSDANETSYRLSASGRYTVTQSTDVEAGAQREQLVERRDSSGRPDGIVTPITFLQSQVYARLHRDTGKFRGFANLDYTVFDFRSTRALSPTGAIVDVIDQNARDQNSLRASLRAEYMVTMGFSVFAQGTGTRISYRLDQSAPGIPNLDGTNLTALVGILFGPGQLIQGSIGAGYVRRSFKTNRFATISGVAANADIRYFLTPLVTLSLVASRSVEEAVLQGSTGFVANSLEVRADYELLRSLILNARGSYRYNDFRDSSRIDKIAEAGAGARYSANRRLSFDFDVAYVHRTVTNDAFSPTYSDVRTLVGTRYSF
ncbi:outer membrane beta-barrel protein [Sphingomonas sp. R86520]|uniref:outer membrane beta-barrel protein n=1 Tax=Sphingomonas sp. R86520 TaxID=3093859 RepID=UPI0036D27862